MNAREKDAPQLTDEQKLRVCIENLTGGHVNFDETSGSLAAGVAIIDLRRFVYGRASHHLAIQFQRPGPVIRAFLDIRKLESNLEDGIHADRGAAHSEIPSV
ncbi:MAG TPA: hypothetical protein VGL87_15865 [Steroidobacteraceae bacterium]|jgi:hypothetical protein